VKNLCAWLSAQVLQSGGCPALGHSRVVACRYRAGYFVSGLVYPSYESGLKFAGAAALLLLLIHTTWRLLLQAEWPENDFAVH
jgi:hypothetical protein